MGHATNDTPQGRDGSLAYVFDGCASLGGGRLSALWDVRAAGRPLKIEGVDLGPKGDGTSDERITKQKLFDADGNFAGVVRLVHIVLEPEEDSHGDIVTLGINAVSLPKGTLYGQVLMDYKSDFWDDELPKDTATIAVVGGTGAYLKSKGQIVVTFDRKRLTPTRAEFRLYCE